MEKFTVTLDYLGRYGFMEYDPETKKVTISLNLPDKEAAIQKFLDAPVTLSIPNGETIRDFATIVVNPLEDVKSFKLAITKLWSATGVRVEWSMPPKMTESLV
jgi:hypothetical protein